VYCEGVESFVVEVVGRLVESDQVRLVPYRLHSEGRYKAIWKREFKRKAGLLKPSR